ncbi:MAG TPA: SDR family NAD(P)-dependent oxidoreductase [Candidatus Limnocylindrales bacterium]|nr:SDR family NAD(P)-dependent oxidoreductase [Candidatus Limnocylindrales bacterium]
MNPPERTVLVTGATGGLGRVAVRQLAAGGARIGIVSSNRERLDALAREASLAPDRSQIAVADLGDPDQARSAVRAIEHSLGGVDVAIHLVGGYRSGTPVVDLTDTDVTEMLEHHLWTTLHVARAVVPGMVERGFGRMIAVSIPNAGTPGANMGAYAVGKAAQESLLLALSREVAGSGVTVNVLQVRAIDVAHERDRERTNRNASWTTPEEIVAAIAFLASDAARSINGARIPLYGAG